jgi:hypothetical protein
MVSKSTLSLLEMETIEDYFEYILESKANGQHAQARELFGELSEGMQGQRAEFFNWVETTYYYEAQDTDGQDEMQALVYYFTGRQK